MMDEKFVMEILQSREDRRDKQVDLISIYKSTLISFTLNTPGIIKDNEMYREIHKEGMASIVDSLLDKDIEIIYQEEINKSTGSEGYIVVDLDALELKSLLIDLEESHPMGRIFDIDVFDGDHNQISRSDLSLSPRKCLICGQDARVCAREKNHTYQELYNKVVSLWKEYNKQ